MARPPASNAEQELYREIRRAIAERRLMPGTKLTEATLAQLFNVSRASVRKVLLLLAKEYIVKQEPNRGTSVWRPSVSESYNILEARRLVELHLVREAAKNATPDDLKHLKTILEQERIARAENDNARMMRLTGDFHMALAACAKNPILTEFLNGLVSRCYLMLAVYQKRDAQHCPQSDHAEIVECIVAGDADAAERNLRIHFAHIENELALVEDTPETPLDLGAIFKNAR